MDSVARPARERRQQRLCDIRVYASAGLLGVDVSRAGRGVKPPKRSRSSTVGDQAEKLLLACAGMQMGFGACSTPCGHPIRSLHPSAWCTGHFESDVASAGSDIKSPRRAVGSRVGIDARQKLSLSRDVDGPRRLSYGSPIRPGLHVLRDDRQEQAIW